MMRRAEAACLAIAGALAMAGLVTLIAFAAATLLDGVLRAAANRPIAAVDDVGPFVVAAGVSACFPLAQLQRANISIDLIGLAAGPRTAQVARAFAALLVLVVMAATARQMLLYAGDDASAGDATVMLGVPTAPFWYFVAAMFGCAALAQIVVAVVEAARCLMPSAQGH